MPMTIDDIRAEPAMNEWRALASSGPIDDASKIFREELDRKSVV